MQSGNTVMNLLLPEAELTAGKGKVSGFQGFRVSGFQGFKGFRLSGFQVSRFQGFKVSGFQGSQDHKWHSRTET
jgi:hypothetical protein